MKVLNCSETSLLLDDINIIVTYSRGMEPQEIPDKIAKRSKNLKWAIRQGLIMDVTSGMPSTPPPLISQARLVDPEPEEEDSPFLRRQALLVEDDHFGHVHEKPEPRPKIAPKTASEVLVEGQTPVVWTGPACDAGGYARMNRKFMFGLSELGVPVKYKMHQSLEDMDKETTAKLARLTQTRVPPDAPMVYGMTAPLIYDWSRYKMLFTMMETRSLHKDYVERCNTADEIIVPSHWCKGVFKESGVTRPMHVVPLGVDTSIYRPDVEPIGFSKNMKDFVFLSVFGWSMRKGYDVLLKAYLEEFTSDDPVTLLISSRYYGSTHESKKKVIRDDIARISSMVRNPKKPHLVLFGDVLSDEMMPRLYAAADCYVLVSRGEGFGLPYAEAGACGLPVIGSRYSSHTDFLDDENSWLVDVDSFSKAGDSLAWISYFYQDAEFPVFGPAAVEQARHFMREAFERKDVAQDKAKKLHERIVTNYDWSNCIGMMRSKISETYQHVFGGR